MPSHQSAPKSGPGCGDKFQDVYFTDGFKLIFNGFRMHAYGKCGKVVTERREGSYVNKSMTKMEEKQTVRGLNPPPYTSSST